MTTHHPRQHFSRICTPVSVAARGLFFALLWVACCVVFAWTAYGFLEPVF